jgi:urea carboxylase
MDPVAFRLGNQIVGNPAMAAGLEMTYVGPRLLFHDEAVVALTGAVLEADLSGSMVPWWKPVAVRAGDTLTLGGLTGRGCRTYLAVQGGVETPPYLGSRSTFPSGKLGGLDGRTLRQGDSLPVGSGTPGIGGSRAVAFVPSYHTDWSVGAIPGPYSAPDYFTSRDEQMFFAERWTVFHNSSRLGYRLQGPEPEFARDHGGEGGTHPSNIHDYAYAIGTVNFTGTMPIVITADGPSLGGFICLATIPEAELWKIGQAKAGDTIRFRRLDVADAVRERRLREKLLSR